MPEHEDKRGADEDDIPSGLAQEDSESPPLGGGKNDRDDEGKTPRGEEAMPGIPTDGEPDSSA